MAGYNQGNRGNFRQPQAAGAAPARAATSTPGAVERKAIFSTGLFRPDREGVKSIGSVQVKEDTLLPAGSYINLYTVDQPKGDKSPVFKLQVTPGRKKQA